MGVVAPVEGGDNLATKVIEPSKEDQAKLSDKTASIEELREAKKKKERRHNVAPTKTRPGSAGGRPASAERARPGSAGDKTKSEQSDRPGSAGKNREVKPSVWLSDKSKIKTDTASIKVALRRTDLLAT